MLWGCKILVLCQIFILKWCLFQTLDITLGKIDLNTIKVHCFETFATLETYIGLIFMEKDHYLIFGFRFVHLSGAILIESRNFSKI